ncbi:MAG: substrate-binding domain-containing protein [Thiotrichales bacterium]|nr:substrate-binding domain-containing protein [Thiotrichales bacterium]
MKNPVIVMRTILVGAMAFMVAAGALAAQSAGYAGQARTFMWNPGFNDVVDTAQYRKQAPFVIGFSNAGVADGWLVTFKHGVEWAAAQHRDRIGKFLITDANWDADKQIRDIQDLLNQDIDLLLVNPVTLEALDPVLRRTMSAGVPVVSVVRRVKSESAFVSFVTASDTALARLSAQWLVETLGGNGRIVVLPGQAGASPAEFRLRAAREVFAQYPGIEILDVQYTDWSPARGKEIMSALIQAHAGEIDGVWADSGLQGSGSVEAFLNAGVPGKDVPPHTGGDLNYMYQLAHKHGFPFCGIDYTAAIGIDGVRIALDVLDGKSVPTRFDLNFQVVIPEGHETTSVKADVWLRDYVRLDKPGELIMGHGLGEDYDPQTFSADYPR